MEMFALTYRTHEKEALNKILTSIIHLSNHKIVNKVLHRCDDVN